MVGSSLANTNVDEKPANDVMGISFTHSASKSDDKMWLGYDINCEHGKITVYNGHLWLYNKNGWKAIA